MGPLKSQKVKTAYNNHVSFFPFPLLYNFLYVTPQMDKEPFKVIKYLELGFHSSFYGGRSALCPAAHGWGHQSHEFV